MKRLFAAFLALLVSPAAAFDLATREIPLNPENVEQDSVGDLRFLGGLELGSSERGFGGLSGLTVAGDRLLAVSDRGLWFAARVARDRAGRLVGLEQPELAPLLTTRGRALSAGTAADAEALARTSDGDYYVAFERRHRLWRYAGPDPRRSRAYGVAGPQRIADLPNNGGIEALAALPDGRLLLIAEAGRNEAGDFHAWLLKDGRAEPLAYAAHGEFKPTDAAALPDGGVLVLERRFTGIIGGLSARITRIPAAALRPGARVESAEVALFERPLALDNYEGLAVSRDADGGTLVWLMSDNNFNTLFQRNLLLLFRLD